MILSLPQYAYAHPLLTSDTENSHCQHCKRVSMIMEQAVLLCNDARGHSATFRMLFSQ